MMPPRDLSQLPTREVEQETKPRLVGIDAPFTVLVLLLLVIGLVALFSASYTDAYYKMDGNSYHYIIRQGLFAVVGIVAMFIVSRMNYHKFHYLAIPAMIGSALLLATRFFLGSIWETHNDATRWIDLGFTEFQPSEIAKLAVIVCFASMMSIYGPKKMHTFRYGIAPYVLMLGALCGLIYSQPHFSAIVIILGIGAVMMFVGGANLFWLGLGGGSAAVGLIAIDDRGPFERPVAGLAQSLY